MNTMHVSANPVSAASLARHKLAHQILARKVDLAQFRGCKDGVLFRVCIPALLRMRNFINIQTVREK